MSDERDQEPGKPEHEHHGVVETIREEIHEVVEEIHEVVEHVPQPVRWTVGKLVRIALLSLVALILVLAVSTAAYLANRTELVAHELTLVLNHTLRLNSDLEIEMRDIKGNPFTGFRVIEPRVRYRDGAGTVLEAPEMRVGYGALSLLRGGRGPLTLLVREPVVRLDLGPNGTLRFPKYTAPPKKSGARPRALDFSLELRNATIRAPKPYYQVKGLDLFVEGATGPQTRVDITRMRYRDGPWNSRLDDLRAGLRMDADSTRFSITRLRASDLSLTASGRWRNEDGVKQVHADIENVRWGWLAQVFDNRTFAVPGQGSASIDAAIGSRWDGAFRSKLNWDSLAVEGRGRFGWDGRELAIDSIAGTSLAGNFQGQVRWSKQGWEVGGHATDADPSHWQAIKLRDWPAGKLNGNFLYKTKTIVKGRSEALLTAELVGSEWVGWRTDSALVRVDFPVVARDSFSVIGWRRGGQFTLHATVDPGSWEGPYTIDDLPLDEWPDGRASGLRGTLTHAEGRVLSKSGQLFVTGDVAGAGTDWSAAHFAEWELRGVNGRLLPKPDLVADAYARDGFFVGIHLDSASAPIRLGDQRIDFETLNARAGDTLVALTGGAAWSADRWRLAATRARLSSSQFDWTAEPPLVLSGDREGVLSDRVIANDGDSHLEARGRWAAPGGFYDFALDARQLDLARIGLPLELGFGGRADARLAVSGRSGHPRWSFEGRTSAPAFGGHRGDTLSVSLSGEPNILRLVDARFGLNGGTLRSDVSFELMRRAWPDSLTPTAVFRWLQEAGAWRGEVRAERFPVDRLGSLSRGAAGWTGRVDGTLALAGSPPDPDLELHASASQFGWRDYRAQRVEVGAHYDDGVLSIPDTRITMLDVVSTISGRMPLRLAVGRNPVLPDEAMSWKIEVPKGDLKLLPVLVPIFQTAHGRFDLDVAVAGTSKRPRVTGVGHVREGIIRPAGREEILESVYADLHFDESRVTLDSLTAKQGRSGRVHGRGGVELLGFGMKRYLFELSLRDFAAHQEGLYAMLFDGDFQVTDGPEVHGARLPQVTGDVKLKRGVIEFDFASQSEVQARMATTEPLYWTYRVHMEAESNLRWRPPDGDIEFNADLDLEQTPDSLLIYGEMHLVRGYYFFLSNRFTLNKADLTFDNQQGVDPLMGIEAQTRLKPSSRGVYGGRWDDGHLATINAQIDGRASQPIIALTSPEGLDQTEIIRELTYGRFRSEDGGESLAGFSTDPLENYVTRQLTNQLSRDMSKYFNNAITQWTVEREQGALFGASGQGDVYVGVSGDVNEHTSWTYRQRVPGFDRGTTTLESATQFEREAAVEYRINRFIYVTTELSQRRTSVVQSRTTDNRGIAEFNMNLKARWEY